LSGVFGNPARDTEPVARAALKPAKQT